jgi:hypothetical protein
MSIIKDENGFPVGGIDIAVPLGSLPSFLPLNKFGRNIDIDQNINEDIWDIGSNYIGNTVARKHLIAGSSLDVSSVIFTGSADNTTNNALLIDGAATFSTDGVAVGDCVVNDSRGQHFFVSSVTNETTLALSRPQDNYKFISGDSYRVITATGSGAAVVKVDRGLDTDWFMKSEFIAMNGTTNVETVNEYIAIDRMKVVHSGAGELAGGNIQAVNSIDGGTVLAQISSGYNQTLMAIYHVPASYDLYLNDYYMTQNKAGAAGTVEAALWVKEYDSPRQMKHIKGAQTTGTTDINHYFTPLFKINSKSRVWVRAQSPSANNNDLSAGFDGYLVPHIIPAKL